ncbi:Uncharacterised protein [Vibrio cholerae]|nr:Uncharacterised protein [Vibrio cholerae]
MLQSNGIHAREFAGKFFDVFHSRATPAVNRLVIVTHDHHVRLSTRHHT